MRLRKHDLNYQTLFLTKCKSYLLFDMTSLLSAVVFFAMATVTYIIIINKKSI